MFYDNFKYLCDKRGEKPYSVLKNLGSNSASIIEQWKKGSVPRQAMLEKIAAYFNVSIDFLLTGEEKKPFASERLSPTERKLISAFRSLPNQAQGAVLTLLQPHSAPKEEAPDSPGSSK